jgi:hypothetical protein
MVETLLMEIIDFLLGSIILFTMGFFAGYIYKSTKILKEKNLNKKNNN